MNDRDRLIELILNTPVLKFPSGSRAQGKTYQTAQNVADHLLANGVIVPPCKVGQTVWFIRKDIKSEIVETNVEKILLKQGGLYIKLGFNSMYETTCRSIGKTVFLTKEEAEEKLNQMKIKE